MSHAVRATDPVDRTGPWQPSAVRDAEPPEIGGHDGVHDFDQVFRTAYPRLVATLRLACGNEELAADCVQEAFARAHLRWRKVGRYDHPAAWVRTVSVNLLRDALRRQQRMAALQRFLPRGEPPAPQPIDDALSAALAKLPTQQRIAVALHYVDDLPVADVAAAMQLSTGAVKFHLHQGRAKLRELLGERDDHG